MQVEIRRMTISRSFRGEGRITAVHAAAVHQFEVDVLIMSLDAKVILKDLAAGGATARILTVERHFLSADETAVLVTCVRNQAIVRIHGHCGG